MADIEKETAKAAAQAQERRPQANPDAVFKILDKEFKARNTDKKVRDNVLDKVKKIYERYK